MTRARNIRARRICHSIDHVAQKLHTFIRLRVWVWWGHEFFSPVSFCMQFCYSHADGYWIRDLYTFINPSYSHVFKFANVCNNGYFIALLWFLLLFIKDLVFLCAPDSQLRKRLRVQFFFSLKRDSITHIHLLIPFLRPLRRTYSRKSVFYQSRIALRSHYFAALKCNKEKLGIRLYSHLSHYFLNLFKWTY